MDQKFIVFKDIANKLGFFIYMNSFNLFDLKISPYLNDFSDLKKFNIIQRITKIKSHLFKQKFIILNSNNIYNISFMGTFKFYKKF